MGKNYVLSNDENFQNKITINNLKIEKIEFKSIGISYKLHPENLPYASIHLTLTYDRLSKIMFQGAPVEVDIAANDRYIKKMFFQISSFIFTKNEVGMFNVTLNCLVDLTDFFQNDFKQEAFKEKSALEVMSELKNIEFVDLTTKGASDDMQTWLRYNITEKKFLEYLYDYIYFDNDLSLGFISPEKKFKINTFSNILKQKPLKITNMKSKKSDEIQFTNFIFSGNFDIYSYKLSPERKAQNFQIPTHQIIAEDIPTNSLFTGEPYDKVPYYPYKVLNDNMNTHEKYNYSRRFNISLRNKLETFDLEITLDNLSDFTKIELLKLIEFEDITKKSLEHSLAIEGNYIITGIEMSISNKGFEKFVISCSRDFYIK